MSGSPLGRYALPGDGGDLVEVRLLGTPLELLVRAREHHDDLMREFRVLALAGRAGDREAPVRLIELTEILGRRYGVAGSRRDQEVDEALSRGEATMDLVYEVPPAVSEAALAMDALMTEADAFCADAQLLTLERDPLLKRFAAWYLDQFVVQCAGGPAVAWAGPLTLEP